MNSAVAPQTDTDTIFVVRNSIGVMAYAARLVKLDDGLIEVRAGSARWILSDEMTAVPLEVGECFKHWMHGYIVVKKINRKTVKCTQMVDGGKPGPEVTLHI